MTKNNQDIKTLIGEDGIPLPPTPFRAANQRDRILYRVAYELGVSQKETFRLLCQLYELDRLDMLIDSIKCRYNQGFSPKQIAQLKILHSYLTLLLERMGYEEFREFE